MNFAHAVEAAKRGARIRRAGWYNQHNVVIYVPGRTVELTAGSPYAAHAGSGATLRIASHLDMLVGDAAGFTAAQPGWLASQADLLAADWEIHGDQPPIAATAA